MNLTNKQFSRTISNIDYTPGLFFHELSTNLHLLFLLTKTEIIRQTKQSFFGLAWYVVSPIITAIIFVFVFNKLAGIESENTPYFLMALIGSVVWTYINSSIVAGTQSLVRCTDLVSKVYFPRAILPIASVLMNLTPLLIGIVTLLILMFFFSVPLSFRLFYLPFLIILTIIFTASVALLLSVLNARTRDIGKLLQLSTGFLMYVSPIAYPISIVPIDILPYYLLNPIAGLVTGYRWVFFAEPVSGWIVVSLIVITLLAILGVVIFCKFERSIADYL